MLIAREAARLISEHGIGDYRQATAKAARQLGITGTASLPSARELEQALREFQRLFRGHSQPRLLHQRREAALAAMQFLQAFTPRLVGAVLEGTADAHSVVCLQVFNEDANAVSRFLHDKGVPMRVSTRRLRLTRTLWNPCATLLFEADGVPFEVVVLPPSALRQAPIAGVEQQPMRRGSILRLQQLLDEDRVMPPDGPQ
ncbi:MAG: hypothetical protein ABI379_11295 [Rhodanobacter sp.]